MPELKMSIDELLLTGTTVGVVYSPAAEPFRSVSAVVSCCEHLALELEAGEDTLRIVCVECNDILRCHECGARHFDGHPADACVECGGSNSLTTLITEMVVKQDRGSTILVKLDGAWLCNSCGRSLGLIS